MVLIHKILDILWVHMKGIGFRIRVKPADSRKKHFVDCRWSVMQFLSKGNNREWYLWINDKWESDEVFAEFSFFKKIFPEEEIKYYGKISDGNLEWWMWIFSFGSQLHGLLTIWCNSCPAIPGFRSTTLLGKTSNWTFDWFLISISNTVQSLMNFHFLQMKLIGHLWIH